MVKSQDSGTLEEGIHSLEKGEWENVSENILLLDMNAKYTGMLGFVKKLFELDIYDGVLFCYVYYT